MRKNLVGEQIVGVPVRPVMEDGLHLVPQERVQNLVGEQIVGVPVPPVMEDGLHLVPQERVLKCTREQLVDLPVPQILEAAVENRFPEQIVDSPLPWFMEAAVEIVDPPCASVHGEDVEIVLSAPWEIVQNQTLEQMVDFPAPPNMEVYAGRVRAPPQGNGWRSGTKGGAWASPHIN